MDWETQGKKYNLLVFNYTYVEILARRSGWASAMASIRPAHVKVVCPTAPIMPVTLNAGYRMPSWFDLKSLDIGGPEDEEGNLVCLCSLS